MEVFSYKFAFIFLAAVAILTLMARHKRKGPTIVQGKQFSIRGQKLITPIAKSTPLKCLVDEGKSFGEDFKEKTPPELPHSEACACEVVSTFHRSHDWFNDKNKSVEMIETDLGNVNRNEFRYYKYHLIISHPDTNNETRSDYQELADRIEVTDQFKQRVQAHLPTANS